MSLDDAMWVATAINDVIRENVVLESIAGELQSYFPDIHWVVNEDGIEAS